MSAKKPAPKSAKGKKAAPAKPAAKKPVSVKRPATRKAERPAAHKSAPAKSSHPHEAVMEQSEEMHEMLHAGTAGHDGEPMERPRSSPILLTADSEEADGIEPGSLLAGPRNVQPYIPKRGEQYMSKEQLDHFRNILNSWKRDLMEEVDRTVSHMKDEAANFPDPSDRATQEEEFSLELRTRDRERKLIRKIDEALKRIEDGTYGYCLETGEEIGIKRLEARPVATLSIEAQERRERREKQYGDRDDRYR